MWFAWGDNSREVESSATTFIFSPGRDKSSGRVNEVKHFAATPSHNHTLAPPQSEVMAARPLAMLGHATSKEELGRATWTFLHTLAAQYPVHPTRSQERDVKKMVRGCLAAS